MFAVSFDMTIASILAHHPKGVAQAYREIGRTLQPFGFEWVQGSVYLTRSDDLANLTAAMLALRALPWLQRSVRDICAFKVEHWSDFTAIVKG